RATRVSATRYGGRMARSKARCAPPSGKAGAPGPPRRCRTTGLPPRTGSSWTSPTPSSRTSPAAGSGPRRSGRGCPASAIPPGAKLWTEGDLVEPAIAGEFKRQGVEPGLVRTTGSETRPGMSGGGLFNADGGFVGLHRSRIDAAIKQHAIAATYLQEQLAALG